MPTMIKTPARRERTARVSPFDPGLPDPRPVTDYTVTLSVVGGGAGHSRLTVVLSQPCVIKLPLWGLIDCAGGSLVAPTTCTVVNNTTFLLDYASVVLDSVAFVQVPYQDQQVRNFQGGFVRSGGQWFRKPVMS